MLNYRKSLPDLTRGSCPLVLQDLMDKAHYEKSRADLLAWGRHIKAQRRVRLGPHFSILFENRATVWLQIQEELRWLSAPTTRRSTELLDQYNALIAKPSELCASLFLDSTEPKRVAYYLQQYSVERLSVHLTLNGWRMKAYSTDPQQERLDSVTFLRFERVCHVSNAHDLLEWTAPEPRRKHLSPLVSLALQADVGAYKLQRPRSQMSAPYR